MEWERQGGTAAQDDLQELSADVGTVDESEREHADALAGRLIESVVSAMELLTVNTGIVLGLYRDLYADGPATSTALAERAGIHERYAREWLEQQATAGFLQVQDATTPAKERLFSLPKGFEAVLLDELSSSYLAPLAGTLAAVASQQEALHHAYRTGGGVPWSAYGELAGRAQAALSRPFFRNDLSNLLDRIPGLGMAMNRTGARIAEIGAGHGWAGIAMLEKWPDACYDGYEIDEDAATTANANLADALLADRGRVHLRDAATLEFSGNYDLVTAFECIHDMGQPVEALAAMRGLAAPGGTVLVVDEKAERFAPSGDLVQRLLYGTSMLLCLPGGMAACPSSATGAVMRTEVFEDYARQAGFDRVEVLPIDHEMFRFYRLTG